MTSGTTASIFDLDGVLTRQDTMASLVGTRLRTHPRRIPVVLLPFVAASLARVDGALRPAMHRTVVARALRGMTAEEYEEQALLTGRAMAGGATVVTQAVDRCRRALAQGPTVVATASESTLARAFLDGVGLQGVPLAASHLTFTPRGPLLTTHNIGAAKIDAVRAQGISPEHASFYTDSASDTPLARVARQTIAVNATRGSLKRLTAVARSITEVRWN
ncbi:HAD family hydrolase [Streptomyces sp. NPDC018947]|uniref:HAD family hydrolase n=1 Tax=Streptomyces sp. NPDC018947 TaxID=3365054 RepID=UPI003794168C